MSASPEVHAADGVGDPADMFVDPSKPASPGPLLKIVGNGPPAEEVDLLILGDGYSAAGAAIFGPRWIA